MQLSDRIRALASGGAAWEVFYRARQIVDAGGEVVELTIGEHDVRTDPSIIEAMAEAALGGHTGYAHIPGTPTLRAAVAERIETRTGVPTTPANVMITPGGQAGLYAVHHAVLDPGDTGLYLDPFYATYTGTVRGVGGVPQAVPTRAEDGFLPRASDLEGPAKGAKSLLINSPNNPTGAVYPRATLEGIAEVCKENDLWLISDEVYDTQVWSGEHLSPRALPGMADRTLVVGSMSKSHAMTGSRVGWVIAPEEVIAALVDLATHTTFGVPGYIQDAALFALNEGKAFEARIAAPFARRREIAARLIDGQNLIRMHPSQGAMYLMLDIRGTGLSGADFAMALLEAERIAVMPGESFGTSAAGHVRVAMTVADEAFEDAFARLLAFAGTLAA